MKDSLINPNQVCYNRLDFWDNPLRNDKLFMEVTENLNVPLKFKGTKYIFKSMVPMKEELNTCPHFEKTAPNHGSPTRLI